MYANPSRFLALAKQNEPTYLSHLADYTRVVLHDGNAGDFLARLVLKKILKLLLQL